MAKATLWWAAAGFPDNHSYTLAPENGQLVQRCHLCDEIETPLRHPTGDERTNRAAMHLVHGVRVHLNATVEEWDGKAEGRVRATG